MNQVLNEIKAYIERCSNCETFQQGRCGYFCKDLKEDFDYDPDSQWSNADHQAWYTQTYKIPCNRQSHPNNFLNRIDDMLDDAQCYYAPDELLGFFKKCYRLTQKLKRYDEAINNVMGDTVNKAIKRCVAYVDQESINHGENIMPFIREVGKDYTRRDGLFDLMPSEIAIPLIEECAYVSRAKIIRVGDEDEKGRIHFWYNPETEDVRICHTKETEIDFLYKAGLIDETEYSPVEPIAVEESQNQQNPSEVQLYDYLNALKDDGFLDDNYVWIKKGHTNYHAGFASKIIISNVNGVTYAVINKIIGVKNIADAASTCISMNKQNIMESIIDCFRKHNLRVDYL